MSFRFRIIVKNLHPIKQNLLDADLNHFRWRVKDAVFEELRKIKENPSWLLRVASRISHVKVSLDAISIVLENLLSDDIEIVTYSMEKKENAAVVEISVADEWFEMWEKIKSITIVGTMMRGLSTKEEWMKTFEENIKKEYSNDVTLEVIE